MDDYSSMSTSQYTSLVSDPISLTVQSLFTDVLFARDRFPELGKGQSYKLDLGTVRKLAIDFPLPFFGVRPTISNRLVAIYNLGWSQSSVLWKGMELQIHLDNVGQLTIDFPIHVRIVRRTVCDHLVAI
jgi:hypothetical protein